MVGEVKLVLGIDIDGILCDFNDAYVDKLHKVTGVALPCCYDQWDFDLVAGYTPTQVHTTWSDISLDPTFWSTLPPHNDAEESMFYLRKRYNFGDDIYFITSRPGVSAKRQTVEWLDRFNAYLGNGVPHPTVLMVRGKDKGKVCAALKVTHFIDDKWTNCAGVVGESPETRVYLLDRPWNRAKDIVGATRVMKLEGFVDGE